MSASGTGISVLVVTPIRLYGEGLAVCLDSIKDLEVVGVVQDIESTLQRVGEDEPKVVLLDMDILGVHDLLRLISDKPDVEVIALSVRDREDSVLAALEAGVSGYLPRDASLEDLKRAILAVAQGEFPCSPRIARRLLDQLRRLSSDLNPPDAGPRALTPREVEIVDLLNGGLSNQEIADELFIGISTVKNHVHNILDKLGAHRRGEAAAIVRRYRRGNRVVGRKA